MSFAPDYGLRRQREGATPDLDIYLYDFVLDSLDVLGPGQFSAMVELAYEGEDHALSLDFDAQHLEAILALASPELEAFVRAEVSRDPDSPREIEFDEDVLFDVRARLGKLQEAQGETFIPLVVQEIL